MGRSLLFWAGAVAFWCIVPALNPNTQLADLPVYWGRIALPGLLTWLFHAYILANYLVPVVMDRRFGRFLIGTLLLNALDWFLYDALYFAYAYGLVHWLGQDKNLLPATWFFWSPFPGDGFRETNLTAGAYVALRLFSIWQQRQAEAQRLQQVKVSQELALLKLQLNPDFLFGSLSTLHDLTQHQSALASDMVLKLAHFLRYVLYESQAERVPLSWEIEVIEQYVALQRAMHPAGLREAELEVSISVRGELANQTIAPLLLFPVIEQAFRDLLIERPNDPTGEPAWVSIDLAVGETNLALKVVHGQNNGQPDTLVRLADIEKSIRFHYGERFDWQVHSEPDVHIVSLTLPLAALANASPMD